MLKNCYKCPLLYEDDYGYHCGANGTVEYKLVRDSIEIISKDCPITKIEFKNGNVYIPEDIVILLSMPKKR